MTQPNITRDEALKLIAPFNRTEKLVFLGIRGYYKKSMGDLDSNDIGIYDDAICIISPDYFGAFNGNTDPSKMKVGIATVKAPQVIMFRQGIHGVSHAPAAVVEKMRKTKANDPAYPRTYWAFRQDSNVTVIRHGQGEFTDNPQARFWIDLHQGGEWTTSSEGCQTIIKSQWLNFKNQGYHWMNVYGQEQVPYILIDNPQ
ncbi:MAG: hypothetical protein KGO82_14350 [Bacteroidota bacterium]|nr:hypothetical protein [Bacteroidota bacterium]